MYDNYVTSIWHLYEEMEFVKYWPLRHAYLELKEAGCFAIQTKGLYTGWTRLSEYGTTVMYRSYNCLEEDE